MSKDNNLTLPLKPKWCVELLAENNLTKQKPEASFCPSTDKQYAA